MSTEPVAIRYDFDGYGYQYRDAGHGSNWMARLPEGELLYTHPAKCGKCNDTEWVCENHPDQEAHKCSHCEGAGKPCECTHPAKEHFEDEPQAEELHEILQSHLDLTDDAQYDIGFDAGCKHAEKNLQAEIEALKAEKIRAYDNGYEDGRKPNTNKAQDK